MFWHIVKYVQLKTRNGHMFCNIKFKNQEVLKDKTQTSKTLNYPK